LPGAGLLGLTGVLTLNQMNAPPYVSGDDITTDEAVPLLPTRIKSGLFCAYEAATIHVPAGSANGVPKEA
jgi:hypothetical protein